MKETLCAVASGSGGHILPALIAARTWHHRHPKYMVIFCAGSSTLDKKILSNYAFIGRIIHFSLSKFIPYKVWLYPKIMLQIPWALLKSLWVILKYRPTTIISTGGFIAIPICLVGRLFGSRIEIYELNVLPGKAVKLLMPLAHVIYTPFYATQKHCRLFGMNFELKCQQCAYPIRFLEQDKKFDKAAVIDAFNEQISSELPPFESSRKTIFLLGGSQGSLMLNNALKQFLQHASEKIRSSIQIIHQTGNLDNFDWTTFYQELDVPALTFFYNEHVKDFYNLADLIICRAGAGTIFEVAFFEKPCIVIPLVAHSTSHQVDNAHEIAKQYPHLFTMIEQSTITATSTVFHETIIKKLRMHNS
jgi:UDP-N-acetylglucosamine--N-acetylmuramyl-(pentapeptide) pyrophosphoryl-undecaprenol N-acetylglucosamine transferase